MVVNGVQHPPGSFAIGADVSSDDLLAYIIPPPTANVGSSSLNNGWAILQKLYATRDGIFQVRTNERRFLHVIDRIQ